MSDHTHSVQTDIPNSVKIPWGITFEKWWIVRLDIERWNIRVTPFRAALIGFTLFAVAVMVYRFIMGLASVSNLNDTWPWGLWKALAVFSGVALAGGGYGTAFLVHVLHIERLQPLARSTMLASLLGYLLVLGGLILEIGRWFNFWTPFYSWGHLSPLFEIFICISAYTTVQALELCEVITEKVFRKFHWIFVRAFPVLVILGIMLPSMHQSSLGALYMLAAGKLHPLWWSPFIFFFFLLSSLYVGPAMVALGSVVADKSIGYKMPLDPMRFLAKIGGWMMVVYLGLKIVDLVMQGNVSLLVKETFEGLTNITALITGNLAAGTPANFEALAWIAEMVIGLVIPIAIVFSPLANYRWGLITYGAFASFGVFFNRFNVVITGMWRDANQIYYPSFFEVVIAFGLVSAAILGYIYLCENFRILQED